MPAALMKTKNIRAGIGDGANAGPALDARADAKPGGVVKLFRAIADPGPPKIRLSAPAPIY